MAHSRLERIGTIYTRITNLIRTGAMKLDERPLWYEVYQSFPPATPPRYDNPAPAGEIRKIFYPEDLIRAKVKDQSFFRHNSNTIINQFYRDAVKRNMLLRARVCPMQRCLPAEREELRVAEELKNDIKNKINYDKLTIAER
ncbi:unnamed protein product [Nesidiocoris tenuis]|uniref:Small ribosomal subunit protein mS23 n=1 Tax=Nesidiocoris tenuis TaxID=355587 RepID=A0A6H5HSR5_9HEMI|nr:unnamed protein product [Nesidiocoris tenuis]